MSRQIQITADGSHTIAITDKEVTYHSKHGAIQESRHVFIQAGLHYCWEQGLTRVHMLEMGFGTGLNALLTAQEAAARKLPILYHSIEKYPITTQEASGLNYGTLAGDEALFQQLHTSPWGVLTELNAYFSLLKHHTALQELETDERFHCIYFDAFAPNAQPELWTTEVFVTLYKLLHPKGILVTYCSKGYVRRNMEAAGFQVTKIPGPPGKREMVRAFI